MAIQWCPVPQAIVRTGDKSFRASHRPEEEEDRQEQWSKEDEKEEEEQEEEEEEEKEGEEHRSGSVSACYLASGRAG